MTTNYLPKGSTIKVLKNGVWVNYITQSEICTADIVGRTTEVVAPMKLVVTGEYKGFKIEYRAGITQVRRVKPPVSAGCRKCGGSGYIPGFQHIQGGKCFSCGPIGN